MFTTNATHFNAMQARACKNGVQGMYVGADVRYVIVYRFNV